MEQFDWSYLIAAFGGGIIGAAFGPLPAFILCGLAAIIGAAITLITGDPSFNTIVTWGPLLGPHISFAGGAAATAFAAKKGKLCSGRDILTPLLKFNSPQILIVGGIFGVFGCILTYGLESIPKIQDIPWTNIIALSITINALITRLVFGRTGLLGKVPEGSSRWAPAGEEEHLPWHVRPSQLLVISIGASLPTAYIATSLPASSGMVFGLSAVALIFLQMGRKIPVTHHIILSVELVVLATGNIWWGVAWGFLAAFLAEIFACLFLIHGDSHIDPPAMALVVTYSLYPVLSVSGFLSLTGIYPILAAGFCGVGGYALLQFLRRGKKS